jgi:hypothetical protein
MKQLLIGALFIGALQMNAQTCTRTGSFQGTDVSVVGTAKFIQDGSTKTIELGTDFVSDSGPDLDVYLSPDPNPVADGIRLEALTNLSGTQTFDVPVGIDINEYQYIVIHCTQYGHLYGYANLGTATGNCSLALGTDDAKRLEGFKIVQSGKGINFTSNNNLSSPSVKIYDLNGKLVLESNTVSETLLIKNSGIYFVTVSSEEGGFKQKVFVK